MRLRRPIHQSSGLSEISSQFHDECSAVFGRFFMDSLCESVSARRNLVFGPFTLTTGWRPMVLVTTPPQPASKARMMFASDSVGGADESRNGFLNRMPVKTVERSAAIGFLLYRGWMTIRQRVTVEKCPPPRQRRRDRRGLRRSANVA